MLKYRRVSRTDKSRIQNYQLFFVILILLIFIFFTVNVLSLKLNEIGIVILISFFEFVVKFVCVLIVLVAILFVYFYFSRDVVAVLDTESMGKQSKKTARKIRKLFSDKTIVDVLKLSNLTRYGHEMPEIYVYVNDDLTAGYVAIENISNYDSLDKTKIEQLISGVFSGRYQRFAVVSSELTSGDNYVLYEFEDQETSMRLHVKDGEGALNSFISDSPHSIRLSKDLVWHADVVPHMSIIARTRAGKSVFAGRYMAGLMLLQGWTVEYNSAKYDRYVKEFEGCSDPEEIVNRAEYWVSVMRERLDTINEADAEKYLDISDMNDVGIFFDELGNLNASLELDKKLKTRWESAINALSATGASAGIHIIAISQFGTQNGFLPSLARVNCSDAVIMLGGAADSGDERRFLMSGYADLPRRDYGKGQGLAVVAGSGRKWRTPHFFETPWFD